jgi:ketosteroid isomerase-like protein
MNEDIVVRFFAALEAGDIDTLREIYAPDAVIWHNDDLIEQPVEDNLKVLQGLATSMFHRCCFRSEAEADLGVLREPGGPGGVRGAGGREHRRPVPSTG